ncbi:hypothetical protein HYW20_01470 [Candidatus Woesearchaeota archaeon]|nr:hypothetical protein [Candidatus Woesearchaeota archaeon]
MREKSYTEIRDPTGNLKLGSAASPLLCKTTDKYISDNKDASKEDIEGEIANLMAKCWNQFGEGLIQDVFKQGDPISKNCFVCYTLSVRETSKFKDEIKATDLRKFMFENPYKVYQKGDNCKVNGGVCINTENKEDCGSKISADPSYLLIDKKSSVCAKYSKKSCCYTDYECWNKGGICSGANPDGNLYAEYNAWGCPSKLKCYAKKEDYYSYGDYIQRFGGSGNMIITTDITPGETYAVSFGSPTGNCGWCTYAGLGTGAGTVVAALALGIPTGGVGTVGLLTVSALFGGGYVVGKATSEFAVQNIAELFERDINTIYLTTLNQIQSGDYCSVVSEVK